MKTGQPDADRTMRRGLRQFAMGAVALALGPGLTRTSFGQMSAPLAGLIASAGGRPEIHPVMGVLGASSVRGPVGLGPGVERIYLAPGGGWALAKHAGGRSFGIIPFTGSTPGEYRPIGGAFPRPDLVRFSPTGKSAALLARTGSIQLLGGLDSVPGVMGQLDFSVGSPVREMAVSDDGSTVAVLTGDGQLFYLLQGSASPQLVHQASSTAGIGFLPNGTKAVLADGAGTVSVVETAQGVASAWTIARSLDLSGGPVLVQASRDGASAFVVAFGGKSAYLVDLATGSTQMATLPVVATRLDRMRNGDSFVFSAESGQPAWFLTGNSSGLAAVFAANMAGSPAPAGGAQIAGGLPR